MDGIVSFALNKLLMKILLSLVITFVSLNIFAQDSLVVTEETNSMSRGSQNGFSILIPQTKSKNVISDWKKFLREKNKSSYNEINNEYVLSMSVVPDISKDSILIYSVFSQVPAGTHLTSYFSSKDSTFYSSKSDANISGRISSYLRNFAVAEYRKSVEEELEAEQKKLKNLQSDLTDLENSNDKMNRNIKENDRENERKKDDIKTNLSEQEAKTTAIVQEQQVIANFPETSDRYKEESKRLKALEKEKKKLQNDNEGMNKKIDSNESENKDLQKKIDFNLSDKIPSKKVEISKQELVVKAVQERLNNIH
jgi:hypothetical protein